MKTLVVVAHPDLKNSNVNKRWVDELSQHSDRFTVHSLYDAYSDENIDVEKEQGLIEQHDKLVLQFPMYWFNCPPLLKKWLDEVFTYGWAYGSTGNMLKDKKVALGISAGIKEEDFAAYNTPHTTFLEQLTSPFLATFTYTKSDYRSFYIFTNAGEPTPESLEQHSRNYLKFLSEL